MEKTTLKELRLFANKYGYDVLYATHYGYKVVSNGQSYHETSGIFRSATRNGVLYFLRGLERGLNTSDAAFFTYRADQDLKEV